MLRLEFGLCGGGGAAILEAGLEYACDCGVMER